MTYPLNEPFGLTINGRDWLVLFCSLTEEAFYVNPKRERILVKSDAGPGYAVAAVAAAVAKAAEGAWWPPLPTRRTRTRPNPIRSATRRRRCVAA